MVNKNKRLVLELILIFILTTIINLLCITMNHDEIWIYGFSHNIASGLIPYKDFNMIITPLFPLLGSLFLYILGKNIVVFHIFNSLICTSIYYFMKKTHPKTYQIIYGILLFFSLPNYNLLCLLLLYILINMENKKSNNYLTGIILGITFLTKQNIGIYLCMPTLFTKDITKIIKRVIGFIIPNIILLIYLLINNNLYEFIDYIFLGIASFTKNNIVSYTSCIIITITTLIYLIYKYIKTKDITILYLIWFQGMTFPLFDPYHTMIPFIPALGYFLNNLKLNKKVINIAFVIFISIIFSYNFIQYNTNNFSYPNKTNEFKYRKLNNKVIDSLNIVNHHIENAEGQVFIIDMYAYLIKLELNLPINKYDLLNDGNLGKNGEKKIIKEIDKTCQKEKCTFYMNEKEIKENKTQYNQEILKYIKNTYKKDNEIEGLSIYINY